MSAAAHRWKEDDNCPFPIIIIIIIPTTNQSSL